LLRDSDDVRLALTQEFAGSFHRPDLSRWEIFSRKEASPIAVTGVRAR